MAHEHEIRGIAGWPMVFLLAAVVLAASAGLVLAAREAMVEGFCCRRWSSRSPAPASPD
jgi:hypothetical protein